MIKRLIHEQELAQEISVYNYPQERGSLFIVEAYLHPETSFEQAEQESRSVIQSLAQGSFEEEELAIAQTSIQMERLWELESLFSRAELLQEYLHHPVQPPTLSEDIDRYRKVSVQSIQQAVQTWLVDDLGVVLEVEPLEIREEDGVEE